MKSVAIGFASVLTLCASLAMAEEQPPKHDWELDVKAGWIIMGGTSARATGGIMPMLAGRRVLALSESFSLAAGVELGAFGFGGGSRWIGVLGGPVLSASLRPMASLGVSAALRVDVGRIPTCNAWGLCLRYVGLFPAAEASVRYDVSAHLSVVGTFAVRYVTTTAWTGVGYEPGLAGRLSW